MHNKLYKLIKMFYYQGVTLNTIIATITAMYSTLTDANKHYRDTRD